MSKPDSTNEENLTVASRYWGLSFQYLELSEQVCTLIAQSNNPWMVVTDDPLDVWPDYGEMTRWSDHNLGIPVIFNFYHGIEVLLKGFLRAEGIGNFQHKLDSVLNQVRKHHPDADFLGSIRKYTTDESVPEPLRGFLSESGTSIANWYQTLKYPSTTSGDEFSHTALMYKEGLGAEFYNALGSDIKQIRTKAVAYGRSRYPGL